MFTKFNDLLKNSEISIILVGLFLTFYTTVMQFTSRDFVTDVERVHVLWMIRIFSNHAHFVFYNVNNNKNVFYIESI